MTIPQIIMQRIGCKSGQQYLLKNINWQVQQGEKWIVFGENGSGKTTLLSLLVGYKPYTSGELQLFGEPFHSEQVLSYRQRIGWVSTSFFQKVFTNESVLQIVLSGKWGTVGLSGSVENKELKRAYQLLETFHIQGKKDMLYGTLSKGEQQSVLLACAFMNEPELLLLDEADSGLDYLARMRLNAYLNEYVQGKSVTIICVTHYPNEISDMYNHCLLLKHGRMVKQGSISEAFNEEVLSDFFEQKVQVQKSITGYSISLCQEG